MTDTRLLGPLFQGRQAESQVRKATADGGADVAKRGEQLVKARLGQVLKHPTGFYQRNVVATADRVTDSGVVYGRWLEGTSPRNRRSRFKGYATFRRVVGELQGEAVQIVDEAIAPAVRGLS